MEQMIQKTVLMAGLFLSFAVHGLVRSDPIPSLCDCTLDSSHKDCDKNCDWLCNTGAALKEGTDSLNKKCIKTSKRIKQPLFNDTVGLLSLKGTLKKIEKKAAKKKTPTMKPDCPGCTVVERLDVNVNPAAFKKGSCPEKYIKTHTFHQRISLSQGCSKPDYMGSLYRKTSQYVQSLLKEPSKSDLDKPVEKMTPGARLWHECPEECSFYITYDITTVREFCENLLSVKVHCNHQRKGFLGKYSVKAQQVTDMMCKGFENDKLVLRKTGTK